MRNPLAPMGGKQSDWSRERPVNDAGMLAAAAAAGVAKSVLVQASTCCGNDNRYVQASVQARPERFAGVFSVDMQAADAIEKIQYGMQAGLSGARVFIAGHTAADHAARLDHARSFAAWGYLEVHGIPICVPMACPSWRRCLRVSPRRLCCSTILRGPRSKTTRIVKELRISRDG